MYDGGEPVSDNDGGPSLTDSHQRRLNVSLRLCVKSGSGLVKEDNGRGFEDRPRNTHTLFFSTTQFEPSLSYDSRVLMGEGEDLVMDVSVAGGLLYFFITGLCVTYTGKQKHGIDS